jgi:hypothetical protein
MDTLIWHALALVVALLTTTFVLIAGHATPRSLVAAAASGALIVIGMLVVSSSGVLAEPASGAITPTIEHAPNVAPRSRSLRLAGIGWEVGARPVRVSVEAPGRRRAHVVYVVPDRNGRVDVVVTTPFAQRAGCRVTALQSTILGVLRATTRCERVAVTPAD